MTKKYSLSRLLMLLCFLSVQTFPQVWVNNYNGSANSEDKSTAIKIDAFGNIYVTGYSTGIGTSKDITTIKYNSIGVQQWVATYNGPANSNDEAYAITIDALGNIYVTGYSIGSNSSKDIVTIKYDGNGSQQWAVRHTSNGNYNDEAYAITVDSFGNTYICGYAYDNSKGDEITVIKYNSSGAMQWIQDYNGTNDEDTDEAYAITIDGNGNIYITGSSEGSTTQKDFVTIKYNSSGVEQWVQRYNNSPANNDDEAYAITVDGASNVYVTGYSYANGNGKDYLTIKYNTAGTQQWLSRYNNTSANDDDIARSIAVLNNNDIVITGSSKSSPASNKEDYLTIKYNSTNGSEEFVSRYNDSATNNADIAYAVGVTSSNSSIFVTGSSKQSTSTGSEDIVTLEYSSTGNLREKYRIINPGPDAAFDISVDNNNDFYLTGYLSSRESGFDMSSAKFLDAQLVVISNTGVGIPSEYRLFQNYPNPFNPSTKIRFSIKKASMVKIAVYDILGKELLRPVNDFMMSGTYEVSFKLSDLPSGLYYYKMTAEDFTDTRKMMLIK